MSIVLRNLRSALLDLSAVNDVEGKRVTLQPKGMPGDTRTCDDDVEKHENVQTMKKAGWLAIEATSLVPEALSKSDEKVDKESLAASEAAGRLAPNPDTAATAAAAAHPTVDAATRTANKDSNSVTAAAAHPTVIGAVDPNEVRDTRDQVVTEDGFKVEDPHDMKKGKPSKKNW